jgi:hypothetical protein
MARYEALAPLFLDVFIPAGTTFESDLPPGRNWKPLDDEAKARVEAKFGEVPTSLHKWLYVPPKLRAPRAPRA